MGELKEMGDPIRHALLETVPCAVAIADADMRIVYWNRAAEELTGYAAEEMIGSTCEVLQARLADAQDRQMLEAICPFGRRRDEQDEEYRIRRKDGTIVAVFRRLRTVRDERGEPVAFIQALVDITYLKAANSEIRHLQRDLARAGRFGDLVGTSPAMRRLYEAIDLVAATDASVVIEGQTGTGKELVARTIHSRSSRRGGVFLAVNCGALPETLLEAELFGHVRGAFTGAIADRPGRFEEAAGGTLFLDEIGEMPLGSQVKLLRAVQEGEITRVGESTPRKPDVRIIAATNRSLTDLVEAGQFREDLYYRLHVVGLSVPALRDRREDIPDLVAHFIERLNHKYDRRIDGCSPEAMARLEGHPWPGNVRELEHALEHAFVVSPRGATSLPAAALPPELLTDRASSPRAASPPARGKGAEEEKAELLAALRQAGGNKSKAARILGLSRQGLYKKLRRLGV